MSARRAEHKVIMMAEQITYFDRPGKEATEATLDLAVSAAKERGITTMVIASTTGYPAVEAARRVEETDIKLVIVPHQFGFREEFEFDRSLLPKLQEQGHVFHAATMLFHTGDFHGTGAPTALANILRTFGQGTKVCIEIGLMAADGGHVGPDEECVLVAGTGRGADTAMIATAAPIMRLSEFKVHEILCKPILR